MKGSGETRMMSASLVGSESREEAEPPMFDVLLDEELPM